MFPGALVVETCSHNGPTVPRPPGAVARADGTITQRQQRLRLVRGINSRVCLTEDSPPGTRKD
jgi:hypothetical protein